MRYLYPGLLVALSILSPCGLAAAGSALSITNYHLLSESKQTRTLYQYTYSADLVNTGQDQPSITATVTSAVAGITVQPGQGSLHFPPAPANSTVTSTNFFTVLIDRTGNDDFSNLSWQFSTPVANAGPNQTVTAGSTVTLNGSGSTNPSGIGTLTYSWDFAAANGRPTGSAAVIQNPTDVMPTFVADRAGNYNIILTVSNGAGVNSSGVTVTTTNSPPVADAGPDQTVSVGSVVTLNGSGSNDVDGDSLTYSWILVSSPAGSLAALSSATAVSPTFTVDKVGTYRAQLIVNDGFTNSAPAQVKISTTDTPPVASAGSSQSVTLGAVVQLDGSQSSDVDGNPLTYLWSFNSVPSGSQVTLSNATIVNPTFTPDVAGNYVVQLIVNDGFDDSLPSTVTISTTVVLAPTANAGLNQTVAHGSRVILNGSGTDPQGLTLTFQWSIITKPTGSNTSLSDPTASGPNFTADLPGTYVVQLIVNDGTLDSPPSTVTITTTNTAPVAVAGPPQNVAVGAIVTLDGSQSTDADNDPITYAWSFQSVPSGSNASLLSATIVSPTFIADVAGTYVVQLIVKDPYTSSAPSTVMITAIAPAGITLTPNPLELSLGGTGTLTVAIGSVAGGSGQPINLAILDTSVATVQSTVTIPSGQSSTTVVVTSAGNTASTQMIASAPGFQPALATIDVTQASITLMLSNSAVGITKTVTGTITLSTPAPAGGITVNLSAVPTGIVSFPATVGIASGTTGTFQVTGAAAGSTIITAAAANYLSGTVGISAATLGAITLPATVSVVAGQTLPFNVSLVSPAPAGGVVINLVSNDTTKATVSASVSIDAGATTPAIGAQINGVGIGPATITASAGGFTGATTNVTVVAGLVVTPVTLPVGTTGVLYPTTTLTVSGGTTPYVLSASNLPAGLTFDTSTGILSGTPTANGVGSIVVKDSSTPALSQTLTVTVNPAPLVVSPASLPAGIVQTTYTPVTISATGGVSPYFMTAASLPTGLSFDATTGILSGTPTAAGTGSIIVKDSATSQQVKTLSVTIVTKLVVTPTLLPVGTVNQAYPSTTIAASGGTGPYTMTAAGLPTGLSFNSATGVLSGTPSVSGSGGTITISDSTTPAQTVILTVMVNATLGVSPSPLPVGVANQAYPTTTITATGGTGSYTMTAAGLPAGLSFNSATGVLTGTPTATGSGTITVKDTATPAQTATLTVTVNPVLVIGPNPLPTGGATVPYPSTTITASGGSGSYIMTAVGLPAGLTFNSATGVLSGIPSMAGSVTITVKDTASPAQSSTLTLTVNPVLVVGPNPLPTGAATIPYPTTTITASGGSGSYIMSAAGLPAGLSFNSVTGVLSGTPAVAGNGTITVKDTATPFQTATLQVTVTLGLIVSPQTLPTGVAGSPYPSTTITASGGTAPITMTAANLPAGLTFNAATGVLSGMPTATGSGTITIKDSGTPVETSVLTVTVNPVLVIGPNPLPTGAQTVPYPSTTVTASGGSGSYVMTAAGLPNGLTFNAATGVLSGTPTATGSGTITVKDTATPFQSSTLTVSVNATLVIGPNPMPIGAATIPYPSTTVTASGGSGSYIMTATGLPTGLLFNTATGVLSGTPATPGSVTITVKDTATPFQTGTLTVLINPVMVVAPNPLPIGTANSPYPSTTISATGGTGSYVMTAAGLPAGLSFNSATGVLNGTPNAPGTLGTITVKDTGTPAQTAILNVTINPAVLQIVPGSLLAGTEGTAYPTTTFSATGGTPPYAFSAANLPSGMSFDSNAGVLSGTPTAPATATISVHDSASPTPMTSSVLLIINATPLVITTTSLPDGTINATYTGAVTATGGVSPYTFVANSGMPAGLSMRSNGQITGVPTGPAGTSQISVTVTDSESSQGAIRHAVTVSRTLSGSPIRTASMPATVTATISLIIHPQPLVVSTTSLAGATVGTLYSQNLIATGGTPSYVWSIVSGSLPSGLSLNPAGRIGGIPDGTGPPTATVTLGVTDSGTPQLSAQSIALTLNVSPSSTTPFLTVSAATVGQNLETSIGVSLNNFTSSTNVTVSSNNPNVLVSKFIGSAGSQSVTVVGATSSFVLYVQGLANSGTATITAHSTALGALDGTATVTLAPSAFVLSGPNGVGASVLSNQNATIPMSVIAAQLDSSGNPAQTEQVRAGLTQVVSLGNSNPAAGTIPASVSFTGGTDTVTFNFAGGSTVTTTVISVTEPVGFSTPAQNANTVAVTVQATQMTPSNVTVGFGLETAAQVVLSSGVPSDLVVTLTSSDPTKVLLSTDPTIAGTSSISMTVRAPSNHTQEFYVYGLASTGTVGYTASATGFGTTTGLVTLAPSGFVLESPFGIGQDFFAVTGNGTTSINVDSAILDSSGNFLQQQAVAGGQSVNVTVTSSVAAVGTIVSPVTITGGNYSTATQFTPVGKGVSLLSAVAPAGFATPAQYATLNANINNPNILIDTGNSIGNNLELQGTLFLGAPAPAGGASVVLTVTAGKASLSTTATGTGAASITVAIPGGQFIGTYFMYGQDTLGSATISASSPGYNSATGIESLTPSGIVVYGPLGVGSALTVPLSGGNTPVSVSTAQLDGNNNFIQPQALAPTSDGQPLQASLTSSDLTVGTITTPAIIAIGSNTATVQFAPLKTGTTVINAPRPLGYSAPTSGGTLAITVN